MKWGQAAALALGVMKTVDLAKEVLQPYGTPPEWSKSALTIVLSAGGALLLEDTADDRLAVGLAAAGLASSMHEVYALVTTTSDRNKTVVIRRGAAEAVAHGTGRRVPAP